MQLSTLDQIIVVVYLAAIMSIGFAMKRKAAKGMSSYFLGGRQLPWWALAMSGSSSYFDITGTMWIVSTFIALGLKGMWVHWLWGFPITAFYLAYMGKWIRRSDVMTGAEWMKTRFGSDKAGGLARLSYTLFAVLTISALLGYSAIGMGKFGSIFLPFSPTVCAILILGVTGLYVVLGGFQGIVRVEIVQTIVLSAGAIVFAIIGYLHFDAARFAAKIPNGWQDIMPSMRPESFQGLISGGTDYSFFGALVAVWVAKGLLLCFSGPEQLYDFQRFLAAKDERDASKLGALWGAIHTVRWCFAMAIAVMAIMGIGNAILDAKLKADPETALPLIIGTMLPVGLVGFMLAALLSGFLATFSSTVNGGAAYLVKDVYQRYINPKADAKKLVRMSYLSSALLIVVGLIISVFGTSINTAFLWIFGTLAAGILPPNVLRWYWWRLNGQGYAAGVFGGMALSLGQVFLDTTFLNQPLPLYIGFPVIAICSTIITIAVSLLTQPTDINTLKNFYRKVQPAGAWNPAREAVLAETPDFKKQSPFKLDFFNTIIALIGITALYVSMLYLILHRLEIAFSLLATTLIAVIILYFTWYKTLPPPAPTPSEDAENYEEQTSEISHGKTVRESL
ncbi:MAG: sodium:solute symporter family transporter [Pyrinomonadaceae bacterium]